MYLRALTVTLCVAAAAPAADWPQWLGPRRDGSSTEIVAPWQEKPKTVWNAPVGEGHSGPVVAAGRLYLHTKVNGKDEEQVTAYDTLSGKVQWQQSYPRSSFSSEFGHGPRATPLVDGKRLYTLGVTGILTCWDTDSGKQHWQLETLKTFGAPNLLFGVSASPLLVDKHLILNVGGKGAGLVALDKETGQVAWKAHDDPASYASGILTTIGQQRQAVFLTQRRLLGIDPATGKEFWSHPFQDLLSESSTTPVLAGDLLIGSSVTLGSIALRFGEGATTPKEAWKSAILTCYFATPIVVGTDHLYMVTGRILNPGAALRCVDLKTGKPLWLKDKVGRYHASLLKTGDQKLLMLEESGALVLIDPDPKEYKELARANVCGRTWVHAALADGKLYVRDGKELRCLELAK